MSEQLIGEALAPYAKGVVIATKGGLTRQGRGQVAASRSGGVSDATG